MSIDAVGGFADVVYDESVHDREEDWVEHEIKITARVSLPEIKRASETFFQRAAIFSANRLSLGSLGQGRERNLYAPMGAGSITICYSGNHAEVSAGADSDGSAKVEASVSHTEETDSGGSFSVEGSVRVERDSDGDTKATTQITAGWDF